MRTGVLHCITHLGGEGSGGRNHLLGIGLVVGGFVGGKAKHSKQRGGLGWTKRADEEYG